MNLTKYMYDGYIALQFEVRNLLPEVLLKNLTVSLSLKDTQFQMVNDINAPSIAHDEVGYAYIVLTYSMETAMFPVSVFKAKLTFTMVELDPASKTEQGSYPEEYALPDVAISAKDYVQGKTYGMTEFM